MTQKAVSKIVGELKQDTTIEEWLISEAFEVPFFDNCKLNFTFMNDEPGFLNESDSTLSNFFSLGKQTRLEASELVYENCRKFLEDVGYDEADKYLWEIKDKNKIWDFVNPTGVYVSKRSRRDCDIYIQIACECDWEQEHGLQLVFRQGRKLTRVSSQDGHLTEADAYDKPDEQDKLLSEF